jgi:hypothetical protein
MIPNIGNHCRYLFAAQVLRRVSKIKLQLKCLDFNFLDLTKRMINIMEHPKASYDFIVPMHRLAPTNAFEFGMMILEEDSTIAPVDRKSPINH